MTITQILVPVDFSPASTVAIAYARELARATGGRLTLLHVADEVAGRIDVPSADLDEIQMSIEENAWRELDAVARGVGPMMPRAQTAVRVSRAPADAIVEYAKDTATDLIVMGTHGRAPVVRLFLGAVTDRVIRTAPCPVLTVREPKPVRARQEEIAYAAPPLPL